MSHGYPEVEWSMNSFAVDTGEGPHKSSLEGQVLLESNQITLRQAES